MKITELWQSGHKTTISFELFPARTEKAAINLDKAIDKLTDLEPDFFSVTFGAGGSTKEGSYNLVKKLKVGMGLEVLPYFACYGLSPQQITEVVDGYCDLGVDNLLAVRGDEPRDAEGFTPDFASTSFRAGAKSASSASQMARTCTLWLSLSAHQRER